MTDYINPRLVMIIEYDGSNYAGWQRQTNAVAIQEIVEKGLSKTFRRTMTCIGAGRTDAGVHARGQVAHAVLRAPSNIPEDKLTRAINSNFPNDIQATNAVIYNKSFHATSDAIGREYSYSIHTRESVFLRNYSQFVKFKIKPEKLNEISNIFIGKHDFTSYSKHNAETKSYICNVELCNWEKVSDTHHLMHIRANRFVYGMVRSLVGVMIDYSRGKKNYEEIKFGLDNPERSNASPLSLPHGLVLEKVYYPEDNDPFK